MRLTDPVYNRYISLLVIEVVSGVIINFVTNYSRTYSNPTVKFYPFEMAILESTNYKQMKPSIHKSECLCKSPCRYFNFREDVDNFRYSKSFLNLWTKILLLCLIHSFTFSCFGIPPIYYYIFSRGRIFFVNVPSLCFSSFAPCKQTAGMEYHFYT